MNKETFIGEAITNGYEIFFKKTPCRLVYSEHEFASFLKLNICQHIKLNVNVISQFRKWEDTRYRFHHFAN